MDEQIENSVRGVPDGLREEKAGEGKGSQKGGGGVATREHYYAKTREALAGRHEDIEKMLRNGLTKRVIHNNLGVSRGTLEKYLSENPDLQEAWKDAQEDLLDLNEEVINEISTMDCSMNETESGSFPRVDGRALVTKFNAAKFRLERLGSRRGWNPKLETNEVGNGGGRVPMIVIGEVTDAMIAEANAETERLTLEATRGLEGIAQG